MGFQDMTQARRTEIARLGGLRRAKSFTSEYQSRTSRAQTSDDKRKGYAALIAKYGSDFGSKVAAAWRRDNPNQYERAIMQGLDKLQFVYEREILVGDVYADFKLTDAPIVIEVDDPTWHTNHPLHGEDREGRDRYKNEVYAKAGLTVIRISTKTIAAGTEFEALDEQIHAIVLDPNFRSTHP